MKWIGSLSVIWGMLTSGGLHSEVGKQEIDPYFDYRLTARWQGDLNSLDVLGDGNNNRLILNSIGPLAGQQWRLTPVGESVQDVTNLALRRFCSTSSRSQWSTDEQGAVDGIKNGGFGFHTGVGPAWWQVDLGGMATLTNVTIFNRMDCCSERSRTIQVLLSGDGVNYSVVYSHNGSVFGGISDSRPLNVPLNGHRARYVRLQITSGDHFHLDEVEVYGIPADGNVTKSIAENHVLDLRGGYLHCGNPTSLRYSQSFTLEARIFAHSWTAESWKGSIIGKDDWADGSRGFVLRTGDQGRLSMTIGPVGDAGWPEALSPPMMKLRQWHHVAGTYDGATLRLYIDGEPAGSASYGGRVAESPYPLKIGSSGYDDARLFDGLIDDVRIWNRALSADELRNSTQVAGNENGLALMYDFDESVGGKAKDGTPFGNHGKLTGAAQLVPLSHASFQTVREGGQKGGAMGGTVLDYSKYKLNLPQEVGLLLTMAGVSRDDTDLACTVLGTAAYVIQQGKSISLKKVDVQDLLQKVQQLKAKKIQKIPFFRKLIDNGEKDLMKLLTSMQ